MMCPPHGWKAQLMLEIRTLESWGFVPADPNLVIDSSSVLLTPAAGHRPLALTSDSRPVSSGQAPIISSPASFVYFERKLIINKVNTHLRSRFLDPRKHTLIVTVDASLIFILWGLDQIIDQWEWSTCPHLTNEGAALSIDHWCQH